MIWAGPDVTYPIIPAALKVQITYAPQNSFCLRDDDGLVAFGQLLQKGEHHFHMARILVAPAARGKGYGRMICRCLMGLADDLGSGMVTLNVYQDNLTALNLYRHLGFEPASPPAGQSLPSDVVHMRWTVDS